MAVLNEYSFVPDNRILILPFRRCVRSQHSQVPAVHSSVVTGRARLLGFRVGFAGQNPSLGTLRLSGFGLFRALGFSGLFQAFLVYIQHIVSFFESNVNQLIQNS